MAAVHRKIKKLREQKGWTQKATAPKFSLSVRAWQDIENGVTRLDIERLREIADVFGVDIMELINAEEGVYIGEISNNHQVGITNNKFTYNGTLANAERAQLEKRIEEQIAINKRLWDLLEKIAPQLSAELLGKDGNER